MRIQILALFTTSEILISALLAQFDSIPGEFSSIAIQLPIVGLFLWYVQHEKKQNRQWLDHLIETQDLRHTRTIDLFEKIFDKIDNRQNEMNTSIENLTSQLAVNSSAINEALKLTDLADEIKTLLDVKNGQNTS